MNLPVLWQTVILLAFSNVFMTFAWYAHLKHLNEKPWWWLPSFPGASPSSSTSSRCRQPHRQYRTDAGPTENPAGGDHP